MGIQQLIKRADMPEDGRQQLQTLAASATQMASDLQGLSHHLHPLTMDLVGLEPAIRNLCDQFSERQELRVQLQWGNVPVDLSRELSLCFYRVIQEALHNVVKHSGVNHAIVELHMDGDRMTMIVSDGQGFDVADPDHRPGLGPISMRERIRSLGGDLTVESQPQKGTRLRAFLPLARRPAETAPAQPAVDASSLSSPAR
jgi:signal transduction histidine kinase